MVRLNGRVALHSNNSEEDIGAGTTNRRFFPKKIGFFQLLGFTMMALKLKEHWDGYRKVPSDPVAANNALAPPAYRDDDYDTESAIGLDTSIIMPTRTTRRKRSCCVCCGLNCGLFCKALGIVVLIFTLWNGFKLAKWLLTPSPTGLENMPEFSKSLGCLDATYFYQDNKDGVFYTIPVGSDVGHDLVIGGGAVGTIVIAPATDINDHSIKVRASLRTSDSRLLNSVEVHTPESSPLPSSQAPGTSYFDLLTPTQSEEVDTCMRYDLTVYIPVTLRTLRISSRSIAQVKLDFDDTPRELYDLRIELVSSAAANLLIPSAGLLADNVDIDMRGGYLVGKLPIANATTIDTSKGDTITKVDLFTSGYELPESDEDTQSHGDAAHLYMLTGTGRTDVTYENRAMRPIRSEHVVTTYKPRESELRLTYETSGFNGNIDLDAPSYSLRNVQSSGRVGGMDENREFWVGDKKGSDHLKIVTPGWVGLYF